MDVHKRECDASPDVRAVASTAAGRTPVAPAEVDAAGAGPL